MGRTTKNQGQKLAKVTKSACCKHLAMCKPHQSQMLPTSCVLIILPATILLSTSTSDIKKKPGTEVGLDWPCQSGSVMHHLVRHH